MSALSIKMSKEDSPVPATFEQHVFTVVNIERYIIDPVFLQQTGLSAEHAYDAYDITVADIRHRFKLIFACSLNHLVQKKVIQVGSQIRLDQVNVRFDETSLDGRVLPVVEDFTVISQRQIADIDDLVLLPWKSKTLARENDLCPLASHRGYYVDVWCSADVAQTVDNFQVQVCSSLEDVSSPDLYSLQEIANRWQSVKARKPYLLLRIMRRSRLLHHARPNKTDKWPFQLHLVVGDETGCCVAVFWNILAPRYLNHFKEGTVVLLRNFTVKPRFQIPEQSVLHPEGLPWYDVDINVNAHHPQGEVTLVHQTALEDMLDVCLPVPASNFVSRQQLSCLADGYMCDVAGVITFVGAVQREKSKEKPFCGTGGFWIKRWVHIQDHSSQRPIIVQLYRGVQKEEFEESLAVGLFLVCRNVRVVQGLEDVLSSRHPRHVFVTSSRETQIYIHESGGTASFPFADDATFRSVQQFASKADCVHTYEGILDQLLFSYPLLPTSLDMFSHQLAHLQLIPSDTWQAFVEQLSYKETTYIAVQAQLFAVNFHEAQPSTRRLTRRGRQQNQQHAMNTAGTSHEDGLVYLGYNPFSDNLECANSVEAETFFTFQWRGLNADVILNSVKPCSLHSCPADLSLHTFLSGSYDAQPGKTAVAMKASVASRLVESGNSKDSALLRRFLVLLNVHCVDGQVVIMGVRRAFPLTQPRS